MSGVATGEAAPAPEAERERSPVSEFLHRMAQGDFASVRVIVGIAVIWTIFQIANDRFLTSVNLSNLVLLCSKHHHVIHLPDWRLALKPDATLEVTDPQGRVRTSDPPASAAAA